MNKHREPENCLTKAILRQWKEGMQMHKDNLHPFTESEKQLAEKCHDTVYKYLKVNGYPIEEYYHIAVMGYLKGIQKYCRLGMTENNLSGICWNCMRSEIGNYFQKRKAKKRTPLEIKVNIVLSAEDMVLQMENLREVMQSLTERQRKIIDLRLFGFSNAEVCSMMEISKSSYYRELEIIRQKIHNGN